MTEVRTRTIEANGLRFQVDEAGGGDCVALLLHGFPQSRRCWRHLLPKLAALGWRAVAPDLRGYGGSSRPWGGESYRMNRLVEDAAAIFDVLGAKRRLLIGHDWGGAIAWAFAAKQARALEGLVVVNCPHPAVLRETLRHSWAQRRRSWYIGFIQLPWLPERMLTANRARMIGRALKSSSAPGTFPPEMLDHYRDNAATPGAMTAMLAYYRTNFRRPGAMKTGNVDVPTLLVWGEKDTALGTELIPGHEQHVRDLTVHRLPGVSHWVPEEAPAELESAIADWLKLRRLSSARAG